MNARLYLVDDHAVVRRGLRALLVEAGHDVVGDSGELGVALAELEHLQPDVVLVDLSLGERSGLELLAELQRRGLAVRSVVLTMSAQPRHVANALRLGASGYVLKGSPAEELLAAIEHAQQGLRYLHPEVDELAQRARGQADADNPFAQLSPREREVVVMVVNGCTSAEIARELKVSPKTVDSYRSRLMVKLGGGDITALVKLALRHGLVGDDLS